MHYDTDFHLITIDNGALSNESLPTFVAQDGGATAYYQLGRYLCLQRMLCVL